MEEYKNGRIKKNGSMFGISEPSTVQQESRFASVCVCVCSHLRFAANNLLTLTPIFPESRPVKKPNNWVAAEFDWQTNFAAIRKHT